MSAQVLQSVPDPTLRRLPEYYHHLVRLKTEGQEMVSAAQIGEDLGLHHTQVRKDLAYTGSQGRPKVGHRIDDLILAIETFLNWNNHTEAFLVGAGHMGAALMGYAGFEKVGVRIVAAFDIDPSKHGRRIQEVPVLPMEKFPDLVQRMHIAIGVLATPAAAAQETADLMVRSGIQAIWNFAPTALDVPPHIILEHVDLYSSLAVLSRKLAVRRGVAPPPGDTPSA